MFFINSIILYTLRLETHKRLDKLSAVPVDFSLINPSTLSIACIFWRKSNFFDFF